MLGFHRNPSNLAMRTQASLHWLVKVCACIELLVIRALLRFQGALAGCGLNN